MLRLLLALGSFWLFFWPTSPSHVLVTTIMKANAGRYLAAEECLLPEASTALSSKVASQLLWDSLTKKGTVQNITVLQEQIRGEGATVRISIAYADGTSSQAEEMLRKVDGQWKISVVGLSQTSILGLFKGSQTNQGRASPQPVTRVTQQPAPVPSKQKQDLRTASVPEKPASPDNEPPVQRQGDEFKLAMEKLGEFGALSIVVDGDSCQAASSCLTPSTNTAP
jgi:hypothetical protein